MANKPLTASLHTVTACVNVARLLIKTGTFDGKHLAREEVGFLTGQALQALGYSPEQYEGTATHSACMVAVAKIVRI
jgi:hypothetical protein